MAVGDYGPLETADGRRLEIEALRPAKGCLVARFAGIDDRNAADRLKNLELFVPRMRLPAPAEDEFYHADLIGLVAVDRRGASVGTVVAVHNFGAGDLLEIRPAQGSTFILPFTETAVPVVDITGGRIVVAAIEEWTESENPPLKEEGRTGEADPGRGRTDDPHPTASQSTSPLQGEVQETSVVRGED
jgi:16S rRNA processing protein RimM